VSSAHIAEINTLKIKYSQLVEAEQFSEALLVKEQMLRKELDLINRSNIKKAATFSPLGLDEIKTEPTEIVCRDFLPLIKGAYNVIAGVGGVGKSTVAIRSALHYLRANPLSLALLVMGEDDRDEIEARISDIGRSFLHFSDEEIIQYKNRMKFITVDNPSNMRFLEMVAGTPTINSSLLSDFEKYIVSTNTGFVVLDPLKKFHSCNENNNSEMDLLVRDVFLEIAGKLKIVILVLHHSSKSKEGNGSRGASTITDTARIAYRLAKKYIRDKDSGEMIEDEQFLGQIRISTIKDNKNIFNKYGYKNTRNGMIYLYPPSPEIRVYEETA